jgi:mono/diheme cytochrome c family protein
MRKILTALLSTSLVSAYAGGWATITVEDLPDYFVARQPVNLVFTVRQHGVTPLDDRNPVVEARDGRLETKAVVTNRGKGQYSAALTLPESGEWTVKIHSGFGNSQVELLPIKALAASEVRAALPLAAADRGRRLFVAKGCVSCHLHRDITPNGSRSAAPELTARHYPPEYLAQWLAHPSAGSTADWKMPDLKLKPAEINALVAFINTESRAFSSK